jgi:hypothetical protein
MTLLFLITLDPSEFFLSLHTINPWSTGPAEGQIDRLKVVKRTMYGHAGFDLLRSRVMAAD